MNVVGVQDCKGPLAFDCSSYMSGHAKRCAGNSGGSDEFAAGERFHCFSFHGFVIPILNSIPNRVLNRSSVWQLTQV